MQLNLTNVDRAGKKKSPEICEKNCFIARGMYIYILIDDQLYYIQYLKKNLLLL